MDGGCRQDRRPDCGDDECFHGHSIAARRQPVIGACVEIVWRFHPRNPRGPTCCRSPDNLHRTSKPRLCRAATLEVITKSRVQWLARTGGFTMSTTNRSFKFHLALTIVGALAVLGML